ncbi:hypothetical protein SAMN05428988_3138 [Chitinophaga sp. YR573]|uniref:DUF6965 family protein n=1 Tax=Chitinophaga sp. YR573 TaxID=1881040 RepID=UPI0008CD0BF2|nr:hypothetical protein [Chitinophaga sp. YR573]SEW20832.1 hypothetical protein SAMN05428988_3138 [Chitinophaga sp. YR573]
MPSFTIQDIDNLDDFFKGKELPKDIEIAKGSIVSRPLDFVSGHILVLKTHIGQTLYEPFYLRLLTFKDELEKKLNKTSL